MKITIIVPIFSILLILSLTKIQKPQHSCIHHTIEPKQVHRSNIDISQHKRQLQDQQSWEPFRVTFDFSQLDNLPNEKKEFKDILKKQAQISQKFFYNNLLVKRNVNNNVFPQDGEYCFNILIQEKDKKIGIQDSDLHIYITVTDEPLKYYVAYATHCALQEYNDRPIFGLVNFNIGYLKTKMLEQHDYFEYLNEIAFHELTHVLGFSAYLYEYWVNPNTQKKYQNPIYTEIDKQGKQVQWLQTPKVKQFAQQHYNCSECLGMKLENQGGPGSSGSHWEKVLVENEFMTASVIQHDAVYSNFTWALLEDSGWYLPTYKNVDPIEWGKNKGCKFLKTCMQDLFEEFVPQQVDVCNFHNNAVAKVRMLHQFGDKCLIPQVNSRICIDSSTQHWIPQEQSGEVYGENSGCFVSNIQSKRPRPYQKRVVENGLKELRCLENSCDSEGNIFVYIMGEKYQIDKETNMAQITPRGNNKQIEGYVKGPQNPHQFCFTFPKPCKNFCSSNGYCMNRKCHCINDYGGDDCSIYCPKGNYIYNNECIQNQLCPKNTVVNKYTKVCESMKDIDCPEQQVKFGLLCQDDCPKNTFQDSQNICQNCLENCLQCQNQHQCQLCHNNYYLFNGQCVKICPEGYYKDIQQNQCQKCHFSCLSCSNYYSCDTCIQDYMQFPQKENDLCHKQCIEFCEDCNEMQQCLACQNGKYLYQKDGSQVQQCVETCPQGYYVEGNKCEQCGDFCRTCDYKDYCILCEENSLTYKQVPGKIYCYEQCPQGYKQNDDRECIKCDNSNCFYCNNQFEENYEISKYYEGKCVSQCPQKTYSSNENVCLKCHITCKSCDNSYQCTQCQDGYVLNDQKLCVNQKSLCKVDGCQRCSFNRHYCYECKDNRIKFIQDNLISCVIECPYGHFNRNGECQKCHKSCKSCTSYYFCTECNQDQFSIKYQISENKMVCLDTCPLSTVYNEESNQCQKCQEGFKYYSGQCVQNCPQNSQINKFNVCELNQCINYDDEQCEYSRLCGDGYYQKQYAGIILCYLNQCPENLIPYNGIC